MTDKEPSRLNAKKSKKAKLLELFPSMPSPVAAAGIAAIGFVITCILVPNAFWLASTIFVLFCCVAFLVHLLGDYSE